MIKKLVAFSCIAAAALLNAHPARAAIVTELSDTEVSVSNDWDVADETVCGYHFSYVQRMIVDGESMLIPTEFLYRPGHYELTLLFTCDGYNFYGLDSCAC